MRRRAAAIVVVFGALLLTPGAPGLPDVPGDPTPPVVTPVITGTLGSAGWYTTNVTVNWSVTDPESIILSTSGCNAITMTANTTGTMLTCTAESDGGISSVSKNFRIDKTGPATTATPSRAADANGWYNHDLTVDFGGSDTTSGLESCSPDAAYTGPDTPGTTVSGTCRDIAGNTAPATFPLKYDETAPQASPAARAPDANGWFNHAVTVTFQGADSTSGVDTCTQQTYAGPDDPSVALGGTCMDRAGNVSSSAVFSLRYDETPPQATATASRPADVNGWYNHALTVSFAGNDATSGLDSCDPARSYAGPDAASASITGACRDLAGNVAPRSVLVKYDATAPQVTASPGRAANGEGWYNAPLSVSFAGTDPVSGVASCVAPQSYGGPDNATAAVPGSCTDVAGNVRNASFPLKYDATPPQTNASPARPADANGWYNHALAVSFSGTDATSGIGPCDPAKTYSGPDAAAATVGGSCRDKAGNSTAASLPLKYDATAPQVTAAPDRTPNAAGWYRTPVQATYSGGDATSGLDTCDAAESYAGPDSATASLSGSCRDRAGNTGSASLALKYDATAPQTSATPSRPADANGWYNHALTVGFTATDPTAGIDSCDAAKSYAGPDSGSTSVSGACRDRAGNTGSASLPLRYDATAPTATATTSRPADVNGWFNHALTVGFAGTDATSGPVSCPAAKSYAGPDSGAASVSGTCSDGAGNSTAASVALKYDATAPQVTAAPSRAPNAAGWYTTPLDVAFTAVDGTAGVASCDAQKTYAGPDQASTSVAGNCRDLAGNTGTGSFGLKYDATAPTATATTSRPADVNGWFNHALTVGFAGTDATSGPVSCPAAKSYAGPDSGAASVSGTCSDGAGNTKTASVSLKYDATPPQATATPARLANANGWYRAPLAVSFGANDVTAGVASCEPDKTYSGPDSATAAVVGSCLDRAGNTGAASFGLRYDATAPTATATPGRAADSNGWYNHALTVSFAGTDATSGLEGCDGPKTYSGPDGAGASVSGACRDLAGNSTSRAFVLGYDATAPQVTGAAPARPTDANGWFNHPIGITFQGTDGTSGVVTGDCTQLTYGGPDTATASVTGTCRDRAGNQGGTATVGLKYDATAPVAGAEAERPADANGWYNHPLTVTFTGSDATAGLQSCPAPRNYSGPDTAATTISGTCADRAGNTAVASVALKYDASAPQAETSASRAPDRNDWYSAPVTVTFTATDPLSGLASCPAPITYGGPDSSSALVSGTCRDRAGNGAAATRPLKYDETAPVAAGVASRPPDSNGWYNAELAVGFQGADLTSGVETCTPQRTYGGPDTAGAAFTGTCSDRAGNASATAAITVKFDGTPPHVSGAAAVRSPDRAGWYNRPVAFSAQGTDATSGLDACPPVVYAGPDGAGATAAAMCVDRAGNRATQSVSLRYDATGPRTSAAPNRGPDQNGWYNHALTVGFAGEDAVSGLESCNAPEHYDGPDGDFVLVGGACMDRAGNVGVATVPLSYDATPPAVTGAFADRPPDANGWYNRPFVVGFRGEDATSQVESCTELRYGGPDAPATSVSGSCRDRAGNQSGAMSFALRYDATAPSLQGVRARPGNGSASLQWAASPDTTHVEVRRAGAVVYTGSGTSFTDRGLKNGTTYRYTLTAFDEAANAAKSAVTATPTGPLVAPLPGAVVSSPPRLAWKAVPNATYYHVQVWRGGRILSAWPRGTSFRLRRTWTYHGRRYKLTKGRYRWYVWPGLGRRAEERFGKLIGSSSFVVR